MPQPQCINKSTDIEHINYLQDKHEVLLATTAAVFMLIMETGCRSHWLGREKCPLVCKLYLLFLEAVFILGEVSDLSDRPCFND